MTFEYVLVVQPECMDVAARAKLCHPDDWYVRVLSGYTQPHQLYPEIGVRVALKTEPCPNCGVDTRLYGCFCDV